MNKNTILSLNICYKRVFNALITIIILVLADQLSKAFLIDFLKTKPGYMISINQFLDIVYTWNYGISFGLFSQYQKYSNTFFLLLNSLIVLYLIYIYIIDLRTPYLYLLIISGGIGNLIDRILRGAVFDFIHIHYDQYHFPVFNLADSLISIGIGLFVLQILRDKKS